ncbi:MAG: hypothetical protein PHU85_12880 [Phycisphaerae bacterium]|nr:hypothetical protein [Phycisphaerae bacterium]
MLFSDRARSLKEAMAKTRPDEQEPDGEAAPVRRVEIPKPDDGVRKPGMTVIVCRGTGAWGPRMRL